MLQRPWQDRLASARTEAEVIGLANEFVLSLDRFEAIQLPAACRPRELRNCHDVIGYAFDLLHARRAGDAGVESVVRTLSTFFAAAAHRLARIHAPARRYTDAELGLASGDREGEP